MLKAESDLDARHTLETEVAARVGDGPDAELSDPYVDAVDGGTRLGIGDLPFEVAHTLRRAWLDTREAPEYEGDCCPAYPGP